MDQYPADRYTLTPTEHYVEWRRDITDPDILFDNDARIDHSVDALPAEPLELGSNYMVRSLDWNDYIEGAGDGVHGLRAVVNVNHANIGVIDTVVDGREVTYFTQMGVNPRERGTLLGVLDTPAEGDTSITFYNPDMSDRWEGEQRSLVTFRKDAEGQVSVVNETVDQVRVGFAPEPQPERTFRERFSLRSIYNGLKRAIVGERPQGPRRYEAFVGGTNWMVSAASTEYAMSNTARWMRQNQYDWCVTQLA
jgi:hypothetical protein